MNIIDFLYNRKNVILGIFSVVFVAVYVAGISLSGGSVTELFLFWLVVALYFVLPGSLVCYIMNISLDGDTDCPVSLKIAAGCFVCGVLFCISSYFQKWRLLKIVPLLMSAIYLFIHRNRAKIYSNLRVNKNKLTFCTFVCAFGIFIFTFLCVVKRAHPLVSGQITLSQDFMWTVGNAESLKVNFPPTDIRFSGVVLKYHYFTELLCAAVSVISSISCYNILGFYMQSFIIAFFVLALYDFADIYFEHNRYKPYLFVSRFFTLSCLSLWKALPNGTSVFTNNMLESILSNVNSQTTAFAFLSVFCTLAIAFIRYGGNVKIVVLMIADFIMLMFTKAPVGAITALALLAAAIVSSLTKNRKRSNIVMTVAIFAIFIVVYQLFFSSGTGKSTIFSFEKTLGLGYFKNYLALIKHKNITLYKIAIPLFMIMQLVCMAPFQSVCVLPKMLSDVIEIPHLKFEKLWFYAAVVGGSTAFFITYHEAFSQVYFIYTAIFFMNLLAIEYFDFSRLNLKNIAGFFAVTLSFITTLFMYTNFGGSGIRQFLFNYDILPKYQYKYIVKSEDEAAGIYLAEHMDDDSLFVTNRTHTGAGEGLSNVYTCFSGKQSYMEGFKYTVSNMGISWEQVKPRLEVVGSIFGVYDMQQADSDDILNMCKQNGIQYAVYSSQFEGDTSQLENFEVVFSEKTVTIYKIY